MKRRFISFFAAAIFVSALFAQTSPEPLAPRPGAVSQAAGARSLTVAFWNIQWFPGRRPNASKREEFRQINAVRGDIAQLDADIIGLEEVRDFKRAGV
ncbi:MAG: hypothetical protein QOI22_819, partial [Verrucomicrobiota bacterium]